MWTRKTFSNLFKYNLHSFKSSPGNLFHRLNWASLCFLFNFHSLMLSASHDQSQGLDFSCFFLPASVLTGRWHFGFPILAKIEGEWRFEEKSGSSVQSWEREKENVEEKLISRYYYRHPPYRGVFQRQGKPLITSQGVFFNADADLPQGHISVQAHL